MSAPLADSPYALAREMERQSRTEQPRRSPTDVARDFEYGREVMRRAVPRRTPEAQADIAAARAAPTGFEVAMQEVDRQIEQAGEELRSAQPPDIAAARGVPSDALDDIRPEIEASLSNAALADTPAVREMGGPSKVPLLPPHEIGGPSCNHVHWQMGCRPCSNWAVANGVMFARHMAARSKEDASPAFAPRPPDIGTAPLFPEIEVKRTTSGCKACDALGWELDNGKAVILRGDEAERYRAIVAAARKAQASATAARADGAALLQLFQAFCAGLAPGKEPG